MLTPYINDPADATLDDMYDQEEYVEDYKPKRWWMGFRIPGVDYRPVSFPPSERVLGYWHIHTRNGMSGLTALIETTCAEAAKAVVLQDWPNATFHMWMPIPIKYVVNSDKFPADPWMLDRMQRIATGN